MRNDNNISVVVKSERISVVNSSSRDSLKENATPKPSINKEAARRSVSVEIIPNKPVEIDITKDESSERMMPPPPLPNPKSKRGRPTKPKNEEIDPTQPLPLRVTRSKIKKEKPSLEKTQSAKQLNVTPLSCDKNSMAVRKSFSDSSVLAQSKINTTATTSTSANETQRKEHLKKKYPLPFLIKIERSSDEQKSSKNSVPKNKSVEAHKSSNVANETFNCPINDQTVTINGAQSNAVVNDETIVLAQNGNVNETVTIEKNPHDSLMTEDNDEDEESMLTPLSKLQAKAVELPALKLKKNEVFK